MQHTIASITKAAKQPMATNQKVMKQQHREATIIMENVVEALSKELEQASLESLPDMAPVSDTSASSASSDGGRCGTDPSPRTTLSDISEVESIRQVEDDKVWTGQVVESNRSQRKVHWGDVEIRLFPMMPGDHPDAQGVPVTIDWTPVKQIRQRIDSFEAKRQDQRRHDDELRLGWLDRRRILRKLGATEEEISEALESSYRVRRQRQQTASWRGKFGKVEELHQTIRRSLGRARHPKAELKTKY